MKHVIFIFLILSLSSCMTQQVFIQDVEPVDRARMDSILNWGPIPQRIENK